MSSERVIRLAVADHKDLAVLIRVAAKKKDDLDLDLLATDGDSAFKGKVRERSLVKLKAKNYDGSDEEWKAVLKHTFGSHQVKELSDVLINNLEVSCSLSGKDPKAVLTLNFRSRIEDITHRLGAIELPQTDDTDGVDLFGWAGQLVGERDSLESALREDKAAAASAQDTIASLEAQLADLIKAKAEHEDDLLAKFTALLNEKKRELRRRARQMSTAKMDPKKLEQLEEENVLTSEQPVQRGRKRAAEQIQEDSESEGFEDRMDVDKGDEHEGAGIRDRSRSTIRTSDSDSEDDDDLDRPIISQTEPKEISSPKPPQKPSEPEPLPPRRELPFTRKSKSQQKEPSPKAAISDDEETASDDEL